MNALMIGGLCVALSGVLLALVGIPFYMREKHLRERCTAKTTGKVIGYVYRGSDAATSVAPKVEFEVDGRKYKAYRHYKAIMSVSKSSHDINSIAGQEDCFWVDEKDNFHVRTKGIIHNYKKMGEEHWPIGTELPVVYNPNKPKQAFVDKVVIIYNIVGITLWGVGALFIAIGVFFFAMGMK